MCQSHFIVRSNSHYYLTINYGFCLNKLLICCLLIVREVVVKFGLRDLKYGHAINVEYASNRHVYK